LKSSIPRTRKKKLKKRRKKL